jgi:hypothetical protein
MAKNSQYGRWRRAVMQAVLWLVLGSTLALAGYVTHRRTTPLDVELAEPVTFGELSARLPRCWDRETATAGDSVSALVAQEPYEGDRQANRLRTVWITQDRPARKRTPAYYLETMFLSSPSESDARIEPFSFLGGPGVLIAWRGRPQDGLYACTVLADGLTVTVQVRGDGAFGPSSRRLLRQVADAMKRVEATSKPTTSKAPE